MEQNDVTKLYAVLESMEGALGGGGGFEGFYGSVTAAGLTKIYESMSRHCEFGKDSFLVDVGGGLGRPLMHALVRPGVAKALGIEVDQIKCLKSESVIREAKHHLHLAGKAVPCTPLVLHRDIEKVAQTGTLDPATHAYSFWEGVPNKARCAFGQLFAKSSSMQAVAVVQRSVRSGTPSELMASYGFGELELVETIKGVHMSGSQRSFVGYIFRRTEPLARPFSGPSSMLMSSYLDAPRLLQVMLPRILRPRKPRAGDCCESRCDAKKASPGTSPVATTEQPTGTADACAGQTSASARSEALDGPREQAEIASTRPLARAGDASLDHSARPQQLVHESRDDEVGSAKPEIAPDSEGHGKVLEATLRLGAGKVAAGIRSNVGAQVKPCRPVHPQQPNTSPTKKLRSSRR